MLTPKVTEVKRHGGLLAAVAIESARRKARRAHLEAIRLAPDNMVRVERKA